MFRIRRDGGEGYIPTPEQCAAYEHEHLRGGFSRVRSLNGGRLSLIRIRYVRSPGGALQKRSGRPRYFGNRPSQSLRM